MLLLLRSPTATAAGALNLPLEGTETANGTETAIETTEARAVNAIVNAGEAEAGTAIGIFLRPFRSYGHNPTQGLLTLFQGAVQAVEIPTMMVMITMSLRLDTAGTAPAKGMMTGITLDAVEIADIGITTTNVTEMIITEEIGVTVIEDQGVLGGVAEEGPGKFGQTIL